MVLHAIYCCIGHIGTLATTYTRNINKLPSASLSLSSCVHPKKIYFWICENGVIPALQGRNIKRKQKNVRGSVFTVATC